MRISVTIGCYNQEKYIEECILSILNQDVDAELEILLGDDGSTDETVKILTKYQDKYPDQIIAIIREENIGANKNFCDLISRCTGKYIAHIDGDDLMLPGKLAKQLAFLESNPDYVAVSHNMQVTGSSSDYKEWVYNKKPLKGRLTLKDIIENGAGFCNSSKMYRKSCVLPRDELILPTKVVGDWLFHIMNARFGDFGYIDEILGEYRRTEISLVSVHANNIDLILEDFKLTLEIANSYPESDISSVNKGYSRVYYERAARHLDMGNLSRFKECIDTSYSYGLLNKKQYILKLFSRNKFFLKLFSKLYWLVKNKSV